MCLRAVLGVVALTALSVKAQVPDYWLSWAPWNNDNPGCNMAFDSEGRWVSGLVIVSGPIGDNPYTVYRDGVPIASGITGTSAYCHDGAVFVTSETTGTRTYFTDYDAMPGMTYTYRIESSFQGVKATISGNSTCAYICGADLNPRELAFKATDGSSTKKFVSATLYRQTATGKTNISLSGTAVGCSASWISASIVDGGINVSVTPNDFNEAREGTVTLSYADYSWPIKVTQAGNPAFIPSAPTGVSATDGTSTANCTVSWGAVAGATSYTVFRHTANASGSAKALKTGVTGTSYADTTATPGTLYYYWVKAVGSGGASGFSASDSGYRKLSAPTISAATGSTSGVALSWGAVTGATHYRVFRATSAAGSKTALGTWQTGRTYTDTSGTANVTYHYFVRAAVDSSGTRPGDYSASKTGMKLAIPSAPSSVSATDGSATASVTVSWRASSGATSYTVFRHTANASGSAAAIASGVTGTSYTDASVAPGVQHWYWIKAVNSVGTSGFSNTDSGWRKASNDAFASAIAISGYSGSVSWGNYGATAQSGEPNHADGGNNSVWWTWTAPALGTMEISTLGSAIDTVLAVYTGTAVGSLTKVVANDDSTAGGTSTSRVMFDTAGNGTVYRIAVAGFGGESGAIMLSWKFVAANAAVFTGCSFNASTGAMHVAFKAKKGLTYQIQQCQTLGGTWTTVKTVTATAAGTLEADVAMPTSWPSGFVRIVTND